MDAGLNWINGWANGRGMAGWNTGAGLNWINGGRTDWEWWGEIREPGWTELMVGRTDWEWWGEIREPGWTELMVGRTDWEWWGEIRVENIPLQHQCRIFEEWYSALYRVLSHREGSKKQIAKVRRGIGIFIIYFVACSSFVIQCFPAETTVYCKRNVDCTYIALF